MMIEHLRPSLHRTPLFWGVLLAMSLSMGCTKKIPASSEASPPVAAAPLADVQGQDHPP